MPTTTRRDLTDAQKKRRKALIDSGLSMVAIAAMISKADGEACTRQAVSAEIRDADKYGSDRIRRGFAKAVGGNLYALFPEHYKRRGGKRTRAEYEAAGGR